MQNKVCILLGSYNGALYLGEQIQSIVDQTYRNWELLIRDDGSSDETCSIIDSYSMLDDRIQVVTDGDGNLGACGNFSRLLEFALAQGYEYYAFADQDDVWLPEKLSMMLESMKLEESAMPEQPLLVHSDMEVVDSSLKTINSSFMRYQGVANEDHDPLRVLLVQNYVTGCATLINRALAEMAIPFPKEVLMHDWWLALCAALFGQIIYIDRPLLKYRQHNSNEIGAQSLKSHLNPFKTSWINHWIRGRDNLVQSLHQARVLAERIKMHDPENKNLEPIVAYSNLLNQSPVNRLIKLNTLGVHAQSKLRQALLLSRLLFSRSSKE